jgi:hypothetical protein
MIGAGLGVVADVALAGLSLGAATTLGATVGGALSGGWRPLWRKLENLQGVQELTADDAVLLLLAEPERPGCRPGPARPRRSSACGGCIGRSRTPTRPCEVVGALSAARGHPDWERGVKGASDDGERGELQDEVARRLLPRLLEPTDAWMTRRRQPLPCAQNPRRSLHDQENPAGRAGRRAAAGRGRGRQHRAQGLAPAQAACRRWPSTRTPLPSAWRRRCG